VLIEQGIKRRKVSCCIPEEEFAKDKRPVDIITLRDIEMEYTLVLSQLRLSSQMQELHEHGEYIIRTKWCMFYVVER
jgi:nuclear pore complex protein Nup160